MKGFETDTKLLVVLKSIQCETVMRYCHLPFEIDELKL